MALTPLDVEHQRFRTAFRGYQREEVEQFRTRVMRALEEYIDQIGQLRARIGELEHEVSRFRESEELLKNSVVLAQKTCDELIAAAHQRADAIKRDAEGEGEAIRRQLAGLRAQREQFEYAFHGLLSGFLHRLEQGNPRLVAGREAPAELAAANEPAAGRSAPVPHTEAPSPAEAAPRGRGMAETAGETHPPRSAPPVAPPLVPVPGIPPVPPIPSRPESPSKPDRDADIADFSRALDRAEVQPGPAWPPASAASEGVGEDMDAGPSPEAEPSLFAPEGTAEEPAEPSGEAVSPPDQLAGG